MKNELIETSIKTKIGMLPEVMNKNNQYIKEEFGRIVSENDKVILDVDCDSVKEKYASFKNLTIDGTALNSISLQRYATLDSSIAEIREVLESINLLAAPAAMTYGASDGDAEYDMTSFFSTATKGIVPNITVNELSSKKLYRMVENIKIPLQIGTILVGNEFKMVVYHDHIDINNEGNKVVMRVFVALTDSKDGKNVLQSGSAESIVL